VKTVSDALHPVQALVGHVVGAAEFNDHLMIIYLFDSSLI